MSEHESKLVHAAAGTDHGLSSHGGALDAQPSNWTASATAPQLDENAPVATVSATAAPTKTAHGAAWGMLLVLVSSLAFSTMALLVAASRAFPSFQHASVRFWIQAVASLAAIAVTKRTELSKPETWLGKASHRRLLVMRGVWGAGGVSAFYYALTQMHLSDATALMFANVPLTAVFARVLLGEPYTVVDGVTGVLALIGVALVAQPAFLFGNGGGAGQAGSAISIPALLCSLFGAAAAALAYVTIRQIGKTESSLVVVLYFSVVGGIIGPIGMAALGQPFVMSATPSEVAALLGQGIAAFGGQILLNHGMVLAPAGPASVMRYADVVMSIIFQVVLLRVVPDALKLVGCFMIMTCVAAVYWKTKRKGAAPTPATAPPAATDEASSKAVEDVHLVRSAADAVVDDGTLVDSERR